MPTTASYAASEPSSPAAEAARRLDVAASMQASSVDSLLESVHQHTGLVKVQGPFTDRQLESIADGMIYLKRLGLVSIIVVDSEDWPRGPSLSLPLRSPSDPFYRSDRSGGSRYPPSLSGSSDGHRQQILRETQRLAEMLEGRGGEARPMLQGLLRLGDGRGPDGGLDLNLDYLSGLRSAIRHRQIPVVPPLAVNESCASVCIPADEAVRALARSLARVGSSAPLERHRIARLMNEELETAGNVRKGRTPLDAAATSGPSQGEVDLTPLRLMVINREGGIPSPARNGDPHLSINLASEYSFIHNTFRWHRTHPTSLSNLTLMRNCLKYLSRSSSGLVVSHRSPKSLIANLITNRPAYSPSLKHATLRQKRAVAQGAGPATPTLIRLGLDIRVVRGFSSIDQDKMTALLEDSFGKKLDARAFWERLRGTLDFAIIAGDYQGAAIVTLERDPLAFHSPPTAYLDKFAVLPSLQGEGTVDFLWGALRDESFGLGCFDALNTNGGLGGRGTPVDLVWRSRSNNPVNRWYWERSNGSLRMGKPKGSQAEFSLFWCFAEKERLGPGMNGDESEEDVGGTLGPSREGIVDPGHLQKWARTVANIPSCWL